MPWWGWVTIGGLLLAAEMTIVDLEFYLIFLGISALLTGAVVLAEIPLPYWGQWLLFAALALVSLFVFRKAVYAKLRPPPEGAVREGVAGESALCPDAIPAGATGTATLRGSNWSARNVGDRPIGAGERATVVRADGLTLEIRAES